MLKVILGKVKINGIHLIHKGESTVKKRFKIKKTAKR